MLTYQLRFAGAMGLPAQLMQKLMRNRKYRLTYLLLYSCLLLSIPKALFAGGAGEKDAFDLHSILVHHLMDSVILEWNIGGAKVYASEEDFADTAFLRRYTFQDEEGRIYRYKGGVPMHLTRRVVQMMLLGALLVFLGWLAARSISSNPYRISGRFANIVESLFLWCRKDVVDSNMQGHGKPFYSYMLTLFCFLLFLNLGGLLPPLGEGLEKLYHYLEPAPKSAGHSAGFTESPWIALWPGITASGDLSVSLALALMSAVLIWLTGFCFQGYGYLWRVVPKGVPAPLYILLWPLEFLVSPLAKAFALTIRLLANMTAGHVIILALLGFIFQSAPLWQGGSLSSLSGAATITLAAVAGTVAIYFLEIMVAFLQAFIFTLLTALFVGSAAHRH